MQREFSGTKGVGAELVSARARATTLPVRTTGGGKLRPYTLRLRAGACTGDPVEPVTLFPHPRGDEPETEEPAGRGAECFPSTRALSGVEESMSKGLGGGSSGPRPGPSMRRDEQRTRRWERSTGGLEEELERVAGRTRGPPLHPVVGARRAQPAETAFFLPLNFAFG